MRESLPPSTHQEDLGSVRKLLSRRNFLKVAGLGLVGGAVGVSIPPIYEGLSNTFNRETLEKGIKDLEEELSSTYGISIRVWTKPEQNWPTGEIKESLKEKSLYRAHKSLVDLKNALAFYPATLITNNLKGIEIVYSVRPATEGEVAGEATPEAYTSFGGSIVIRAGYQSALSYDAAFGEVLDAYVLHHEIAHALTSDLPKNEWEALHPNVEYVGNEWVQLRQNKPKGFASPYGAHSVDEDIATVAELLFADPKEVEQLTQSDPILKDKLEYLKRWYEKKSGGEMKF